jgi:hypothetical protein
MGSLPGCARTGHVFTVSALVKSVVIESVSLALVLATTLGWLVPLAHAPRQDRVRRSGVYGVVGGDENVRLITSEILTVSPPPPAPVLAPVVFLRIQLEAVGISTARPVSSTSSRAPPARREIVWPKSF